MEQNLPQDIPLHKRDDKPNKNPSEDIAGRIRGLEQARTYEGMSRADVAALDRSIAKLKLKLA